MSAANTTLSVKSKISTSAGTLADEKKGETHDCKGKNSCKGKGGCKSGDNGCAGKNTCKGKGGCAVKDGKPVHGTTKTSRTRLAVIRTRRRASAWCQVGARQPLQ